LRGQQSVTQYYVKPSPWYTIVTSRTIGDEKRESKFQNYIPVSNINNGIKSAKTNNRIRKGVYVLANTSKRKINWDDKNKKWFYWRCNLITLTLSQFQNHTDTEILNLLLQPFLRILREKYNARYLWIAEIQDISNIHFHITSDKYIDWLELREIWNKLQRKINPNIDIKNTNSTDVHACRNIRSLSAYLTKYLTKSDTEKKNITISKMFSQCAEIFPYIDYSSLAHSEFVFHKRKPDCKLYDCSNTLKLPQDYLHAEHYADELNDIKQYCIDKKEFYSTTVYMHQPELLAMNHELLCAWKEYDRKTQLNYNHKIKYITNELLMEAQFELYKWNEKQKHDKLWNTKKNNTKIKKSHKQKSAT